MPFVVPLRPEDPRTVGSYRLSGRITGRVAGRGTTASYLARLTDGSTVTVSLLPAGVGLDSESRRRFAARATDAHRVAPFCTVPVVRAGFDGDQPFLVSEFVEGPSLREVVEAQGPVMPAALMPLAIGAATGLAAIHQGGLVHGNFGPDDVVIGPRGPRISNFGDLGGPGDLRAAPAGGAASPAADILAWARTVLFAAGAPRNGADLADELRALDDVPGELRAAVAASLAPEPASRPSARQLITTLIGTANPPAGLLAEGSRRARAAGLLSRVPPPAGPADVPVEEPQVAGRADEPAEEPRVGGPADEPAEEPRVGGPADEPAEELPHAARVAQASDMDLISNAASPEGRSTSRRVALAAVCVACLAIIAGIGAFLALDPASHNSGATQAAGGTTSSRPSPRIPRAAAGNWSGIVRQTHPILHVMVHIRLSAGSASGSIAYAELRCSGRLRLVAAEAGSYRLQQGITTGQKTCKNGVVTLTQRSASAMTFSFGPSNGPKPTGLLDRTP